MPQRIIDTPHGTVTYILSRKNVKNFNLRVGNDGIVKLSVPTFCTPEQADDFVLSKSAWIVRHQQRDRQMAQLLPEMDRKSCRRLLEQALDRVYPLVEGLGVAKPELKVRKMTSQWGNCHWMEGYITLNSALHQCPERLTDYVALHELIHFLHPNHGPEFYAVFDTLMPDWTVRRKELKDYVWAIRN